MKNYIKNAGWIFGEKVIRVIVTFIAFAFISRQIGPSDTGILTFCQSLVLMLLCLTNLGLDSILINEFSHNKNEKNNDKKLYSTVMISKLILSIICAVLASIIALFLDISYESKIVFLLSIVSLVFQSSTTFYAYYQAKEKASILAKYSLITLFFCTLIKIFLIYKHAGVYWYAFSYTLDIILLYFILSVNIKANGLTISFEYFDRVLLKDLLKKSYPIILSSILVVLYTRLDQFMILKMMGSEALGIFSVAIKISEAYSFVPVAVATSFFPLIIGNVENKKNVRLYFDLVCFSAIIPALFVILFSWLFLEDIFGSAYAGSLSVISITVFSTVFAVLGSACTNYLVVINLTYMRLVRAAIGLVMNFILNLILIPRFGIIGAAYASLVSQMFSAFLANLLNKKTWPCFIFQFQAIVTLGSFGVVSLARKMIKDKK